MLATQDRFQKKVTARLPLAVLKPEAKRLAVKVPNLVAAPKWTLEPGQGIHGPLGHRLREGPGLPGDRAPRQAAPGFLDGTGGRPAADQAGGDRGPAGRLHAAGDDGPGEPRLPRPRTGSRSPGATRSCRSPGSISSPSSNPASGRRGRRSIAGSDAKKAAAEMVAALYDRSLGRLPAARLAVGLRRLPRGRVEPASAVREHAQATPAVAGRLAAGAEGRADDLPLLPGRHHGQPLGLHVLRRQRAAGVAAASPWALPPGLPMAGNAWKSGELANGEDEAEGAFKRWTARRTGRKRRKPRPIADDRAADKPAAGAAPEQPAGART